MKDINKAVKHHEYGMDVNNLTKGQLVESYADLKAHADKLAEALRDVLESPRNERNAIALLGRVESALAAYKESK